MNIISQAQVVTPHRIWRLVLISGLMLLVVASIALWHLRRDALNNQTREIGLLSLALTDELDRGLRGVEEGLQALRSELGDARLHIGGAEATRALRTRADLMPLVRTLWLLDQNGRVLSASHATLPPELSSFVPTQTQLSEEATAVSRPFLALGTNESMVALSIRTAQVPGMAGGWVIAALPATSLLGAFAATTPAADAHMAVFRNDGVRLAGTVVATSILNEASIAQRLSQSKSTEIRRFSDGSERLLGLNALPRYNLKVMLTRDLSVILADWRATAEFTGVALMLLLMMMGASVYFVQRSDRHRFEAQAALQAELSRASKLESLGTLAGGVAHDFNNVLAAIVGYGEMAQAGAAPGTDQARHLDKMMQAAMRGKALVERILAFSRGGARTSLVFEVEPVVEEVLTLLAVSLRPGVVVEQWFEAPQARLRGDPTQVFEAVMNLCTNALQAMPDGGMLSVQLARLWVDEPRVLSHSQLLAGYYVVLSVADQGPGITAEVMERLFEPFFTTRSAQSGTGLGLAVVHGVVSEFGGAIDVQNVPGQGGARFTLYFPECTDAVTPTDALPQVSPPRGAGQTLLVVDDDPALVALTVEMLNGLGYQTMGYSDPLVALQTLRETPERFCAVVTDEVMPGLTGIELAELCALHAPQIPVLMISGYGGALLASRAAAVGIRRILNKPLQRTELALALAALLH